jgi:hypothetical protein
MADRTLILVDDAATAGPPDQSVEYVVLDMAWTPPPGARSDLLPMRPFVTEILRRHNLFFEALDALDAAGEAADLGRRFTAGGVTWWYHARSAILMGVNERLLWCYLLVDLIRSREPRRIVIRTDRPALADAAAAVLVDPAACSIVVEPESASAPPSTAPPPSAEPLGLATGIRRRLGRIRRAVARRWPWAPAAATASDPSPVQFDSSHLERRIADLASRPGSVLAILMAASFHTVDGAADDGRIDPYVSPILDRLADAGVPVGVVMIGMDQRRAANRARLAADPRLILASELGTLLGNPDVAGDGGGLADLPDLRSPADGFDLGPPLRSMIVALDGWFQRQKADMAAAEALIERIQPRVLFTGWEAARTAWLGAARRQAVPSVAIQHGVVYPRSPDYERAPIPGLVHPDRTCVFGPYERDVLVERGAYAPATVVVTGSPRVDREAAMSPSTPDERERVRAELGISGTARLLLLSAGRRFIGDTLNGLEMAARLLDGPLPGVHIVVKLHPEARDDGASEALFAGLAAAGGYPATPVTVVRDIDLYRLLRSVDAHLGLYSTVLTDAVLTDTPNMIAMGQAWADILGYVAAGVAVPVHDVADVRRFMAAPIHAEAGDRERFLDAHFLAGDATARIASVVLEADVVRDRP